MFKDDDVCDLVQIDLPRVRALRSALVPADAVQGLAVDGKVMPVRLSLFAEIMKGKEWRPGVLRRLGGASGVGVAFLEETFGASTAPARYRHHQQEIGRAHV